MQHTNNILFYFKVWSFDLKGIFKFDLVITQKKHDIFKRYVVFQEYILVL